jgi:hypothetical protein
VVDRGDEDAERREIEKFLVAIERTPWTTGRGPGVRRSDATPIGCAGYVLTLVSFSALLFKSFVAFGILAVLGFVLSLSAANSWHNKRLALARQHSKSEGGER